MVRRNGWRGADPARLELRSHFVDEHGHIASPRALRRGRTSSSRRIVRLDLCRCRNVAARLPQFETEYGPAANVCRV